MSLASPHNNFNHLSWFSAPKEQLVIFDTFITVANLWAWDYILTFDIDDIWTKLTL